MNKNIEKAISVLIGILLFIVIYRIYFTSPVRDRGDSRYVLHIADSILREGNTDLDEYKSLIDKEGIYKTRTLMRNGHIYSIYPIGTSLLSLPVVAIYSWYSFNFEFPRQTDKQVVLTRTDFIDNFIAALIVAGSIFILYLTALEFVPVHISLLIGLIIGLGTTAWTQGARTLWPHGPSMLMLSLALYLVIKAVKNNQYATFAAFPLAFAFLIRPTNIFPLVLFSGYVWIKHRQVFIQYILIILIILGSFFFYNYRIFHQLLSPFYQPGGISMGPYNHTLIFSIEGLIGQLISPNRGLLIFSPVLILAFFGAIFSISQKPFKLLNIMVILCIIFHWLLIGSYQGWWGGYTYGPRYFTDILPYFGYLLIFFFIRLITLKQKLIKISLIIMVLILTLAGIWIHYRGAYYVVTSYWNSYPSDVDYNHQRAWDWSDLQILRK